MDKEDARFILRCFRPDGADAANPDFAEALAWAAKDRDLGDWLARERSTDAGFASALNSVGIPRDLREEIMVSLAMERGGVAMHSDALDASIIGAMEGIRPPAGLREETLAAMERTVAMPARVRRWWHYGVPAAAAAGIAFAFLASSPEEVNVVSDEQPEIRNTSGGLVTVAASLPLGRVEEEFIRTFEAPGFKLDLNNPDHHALFDHLKSAKLPCPSRCLPKGLKDIPGLGCRELEVEGKKGALVCFKQEDETVHLVVFKRGDVACKLPAKGEPSFDKHGKWSIARWSDDEWVFLLMGEKNIDRKRLEEMF